MKHRTALLSMLLLLPGLPVTAARAEAGPANALMEACVSQLDAQTDVGYARLAARCPELVRQLRASDWASWLPARWQEPNNDLSPDGLRDLQRLAGYESSLRVGRTMLDTRLLPSALARLPHPEASRWSRLRHAFREWFQPLPTRSEESWSSQLLVRLRSGTAGMDLLAYAALAASILLATLTVVRQWRRARRSPPVSRTDDSRPVSAVALSAGERQHKATGVSWMDGPRELLKLLLGELVQRRLLPSSGALTVREFIELARLSDAEREQLAQLAGTAELLRFAAAPPERGAVERSIVAAESLLQQLRSADALDGSRPS